MQKKTRTNGRAVWFLAAGILLASVAHVLDRTMIRVLTLETTPARSAPLAFGSTALFVVNLVIYVALVLFWAASVQMRLLPSRGRRYLTAAAGGMLLLLLDRAVKYRVAEYGTLFEHCAGTCIMYRF